MLEFCINYILNFFSILLLPILEFYDFFLAYKTFFTPFTNMYETYSIGLMIVLFVLLALFIKNKLFKNFIFNKSKGVHIWKKIKTFFRKFFF